MGINKIKSQKENQDRQKLKEKFTPDYTIRGKISSLLFDNMFGEVNSKINRAYITNIIDNYIRNNKSKKFEFDDGTLKEILDWRIICDETNNPSEIIDACELKLDIYLKPAGYIPYITINLVMSPD